LKSLTKYLLLCTIGFSIAACTLFTSYSEESAQCEALIASRDSIQTVYDNIDFTEVENIGQIVESEIDSIKSLLSSTGFALSKADAMFLGRYKSVSKPYRKLEKTKGQIEFDLRLCNKQLSDLKQDIDSKKIEKVNLATHLKTEKEALDIVINNINNFLKSKNSVKVEFEKDKEEIKRIFKAIEGK
jgi:hypothetical protein